MVGKEFGDPASADSLRAQSASFLDSKDDSSATQLPRGY